MPSTAKRRHTFETIEVEQAGETASGRIEITPELVEQALSQLSEVNDAYFRSGGALDQTALDESAAGNGGSSLLDRLRD